MTTADTLARLTAEADRAIKALSVGDSSAIRTLTKLNRDLRELRDAARRGRRPLALREQIDAQRARVRRAMGFTQGEDT